MEHTKGKLYLRHDSGLTTLHPENDIAGFVVIAEIDPNKRNDVLAEANANHLVKCWNSHDKLLEACKNLVRGQMQHPSLGSFLNHATWVAEQAIAESEK